MKIIFNIFYLDNKNSGNIFIGIWSNAIYAQNLLKFWSLGLSLIHYFIY